MLNHYDILGVSMMASQDELKRAFRRRIRENHPDLVGDSWDATERTVQINRAYDVLSDPAKRREYDLSLVGNFEVGSIGGQSGSATSPAEAAAAQGGDADFPLQKDDELSRRINDGGGRYLMAVREAVRDIPRDVLEGIFLRLNEEEAAELAEEEKCRPMHIAVGIAGIVVLFLGGWGCTALRDVLREMMSPQIFKLLFGCVLCVSTLMMFWGFGRGTTRQERYGRKVLKLAQEYRDSLSRREMPALDMGDVDEGPMRPGRVDEVAGKKDSHRW